MEVPASSPMKQEVLGSAVVTGRKQCGLIGRVSVEIRGPGVSLFAEQ